MILIPKLNPKQQVNFSHNVNSSLQYVPLYVCLWSAPNCLTILTLGLDMSSSNNKEGKVPSALLYSFFRLKSVSQPKMTLNLIQIILAETMFHLAPLNHFFQFSQLPPTSNAILLKSPTTMSPSNNIQLNIFTHFLFPAPSRLNIISVN